MALIYQNYDNKIELLRGAITGIQQVTGLGKDLPREFCPHILGTKRGVWRVLTWQFAGLSDSGELPGWRCFDLNDLSNLAACVVANGIADLPQASASSHISRLSIRPSTRLMAQKFAKVLASVGHGPLFGGNPGENGNVHPSVSGWIRPRHLTPGSTSPL